MYNFGLDHMHAAHDASIFVSRLANLRSCHQACVALCKPRTRLDVEHAMHKQERLREDADVIKQECELKNQIKVLQTFMLACAAMVKTIVETLM